MIRIRDISLPPDGDMARLVQAAARQLRISPNEIKQLDLKRRSVDARKKNDVRIIYTVDVAVKGREDKILKMAHCARASLAQDPVYHVPQPRSIPAQRPVIVGFGPAGMFAALVLSMAGLRPLVLERGQDAKARHAAVLEFWKTGTLDPECNVQFGEGGAGTFSDGKLNTGVKNERIGWILEQFAGAGASADILYDAKPHIGTDELVTVVQNLRETIIHYGGEVRFGVKVTGLVTEDGRVTGVRAGKKTCLADRVIVATGGASYPQTGSTGDGYRFAREAGHTVVPANPSLVPLVESGETCRSLMGLSLRNVQLTVFENEKKIYTDFGEMLFTHFGLSGPLVLSASAHMRHFGSKSYRVEIDLKPALDEKTLDRRLLADFDKHKNSDFINALGELLPRKLIPAVIEKSGIDPREKVNTITKKQRASLLRVLKCFPVEISGKRPIAEAIVTTGGVSVREVSPKTMESKKCSGLYFAGEVLDVDAYTGGFNLQIAWSTGRLAGLSAAQEEEQA